MQFRILEQKNSYIQAKDMQGGQWGIVREATYNGTLVLMGLENTLYKLDNGDCWSNVDTLKNFPVELLPKGTKIEITV